MPLEVSRLRRWIVISAIVLSTVAVGAYSFARWRIKNALKDVPEKIGLDIQQTSTGFSVSKSEGGHTIFKVQASKAVQYKSGGHAELHDVNITLYGRDSSRFDQIYGSDFDYDTKSGDVVAKGEVQIDLQPNPAGRRNADQAPPKELKDPVHLKTSGLTFSQKTGNATTKEKVEFRIPEANGSAVGLDYIAKDNELTLHSEVEFIFHGANPARINATRATFTKDPHVVVLEQARVKNGQQTAEADTATLFLHKDNTIERVLAKGNVKLDAEGQQPAHVESSQLDMLMAEGRGQLRTATFSGNVRMEQKGPQPILGTAGRATLNFTGKNLLTSVHTEGNVKLLQHQKPSSPSAAAQDMELTAPVVDFLLAGGRRLDRAVTSGPPQISIRPTDGKAGPQTVATAAKFEAHFDQLGQFSSLHGAKDTRIVNSAPGQPDRVSTSDILDVAFTPGRGIDAITQSVNFAYVDGERKAWADRARYTPGDQILVLTGSPRAIDGGMTTTARSLRLDRSTGDAYAEGDVRTTYSDLKPQPGGALLASGSPIHVTARSMTAHRNSKSALYTGSARLWQDANVVEAPSIQFDRDRRFIEARSSASQMVSTVLVQTDSKGNVTPVNITSDHLTYTDLERKAHFEGNVSAKGTDSTLTASRMDVFLLPKDQNPGKTPPTAGKVERIVAQDNVVVIQPGRKAAGDQLVYTAADDKFVLTGGPPSIFDAEQGKITGVSLTLFRHDDRVLVEGNASSPVVTQTRVAR